MPASRKGEFGRLARLRPLLSGAGGRVLIGVGDDAAVLDPGGPVVICTDTIVEDVHFTWALSAPADVGWKAAAVNLSDLAAMAAEPIGATVSLMVPGGTDEAVVDGLYHGLSEAADAFGMPIVGGDTVAGPVLSLTVTALGRLADNGGPVTRAGAEPGQEVVLVGALGAAAAALHLHAAGGTIPVHLLAAHRRPEPLVAAGGTLAAAGASAMIDVSDGLGADLGHLARASGVRLVLDRQRIASAIPSAVVDALGADLAFELAIGGGEDFALVATLPAGTAPPDARVIGHVEYGEPQVLIDDADVTDLGYDHG